MKPVLSLVAWILIAAAIGLLCIWILGIFGVPPLVSRLLGAAFAILIVLGAITKGPKLFE